MITCLYSVSAPTDNSQAWHQLPWKKCQKVVMRLQRRIVKAVQKGRWGKVKALQHLLTRSFSGKALAVKRVTENQGKRTSGIDRQLWSTDKTKFQGIKQLKQRGYKASPLKRIYISKSNGKRRPLGIPTMRDRAMQALYLFALEPIAETTSDRNSYGFRPKRSCADAIQASHILLAADKRPKWILEGDIKGCFDNINHEWLIKHIPIEKRILNNWLKAGFLESKTLYQTTVGTPQGGIISPVLANLTLDGLERLLEERFGKIGSTKRARLRSGVIIIRYADDFIISGNTREILEDEVKPLISSFLSERGLTLSEEKTKITHVNAGFDFLGCNVRKYNKKLIIKPSKEGIKNILKKARTLIKANRANTQAIIIKLLNPILRGWGNYYRHVCAKQAFSKIDHEVMQSLWRWAKRRHPCKGLRWIKNRYFKIRGSRQWVFASSIAGNQSKEMRLLKLSDIPIRRHVKIRADANPLDIRWKKYFEERATRTKILRSSFSKENSLLLVSPQKKLNHDGQAGSRTTGLR
ncbi:MAG: group II intron reverse transcriptase/maturase (plasmid) [Candidatus Cardinium sp.]|uniref:group II intron reverse transcriptase/maturase n=1 Tax=Cardinium endosymbiont of Dermatophagoides farinae TaxID=2597823 RepID=UPI0011837FB8|nr:group II intron reverse transcriptase/maturase [Cardinium endosymbiont of Dermatophagoides farinae]TSJ80096.1 group II intron reverse transcriptase/maturase [Cardinium endosymbiont of Dermatophagoides farinae]TSJ80120.1 group II intron reverse transcriptase/maturase [Cardinium endosymbiont of Dermatophagoides farinae]UWW97634.1 MAG: group II intron reverse transcriptase/maturase [Candidatus Cardinium sp.]